MSSEGNPFSKDMEYVKRPEHNQEELDKKLKSIKADVNTKLEKWSSKIVVSMSYTPKIERFEGEVWTEGGKTYTKKDGFKQSVSRMEDVRMPIWCTRCSLPMNHRFDRKFWSLRGWCYNCNVDIEGEMRVNGTYEAYEKRLLRANEVSWIQDTIEGHLAYIREFKEPAVYFENGGFEVIAKKAEFVELFEKILKDVDFLLDRLDVIKKEEEAELQNGLAESKGNGEVTSGTTV
jgi:hypothetical protein